MASGIELGMTGFGLSSKEGGAETTPRKETAKKSCRRRSSGFQQAAKRGLCGLPISHSCLLRYASMRVICSA